MHQQVALAERVADRCIAGSPARRRGNFLLRGQKKVTKEKALNRTRAPQAKTCAREQTPHNAKTRAAALSLLSLSPASLIAPPVRLTSAARRTHQNSQERRSGSATAAQRPPGRRPGDAVFGIPGEPGVQPALTVVKRRFIVLVTGTAARAQRLASSRSDGQRFRAPRVATRRSCAVRRLFFGDFLLAPQKKVTPPPGGNPGNLGGNPSSQ